MASRSFSSATDTSSHALRTFHAGLAFAAEQRFGDGRCPICTKALRKPRHKGKAYTGVDARTVAHDAPTAFGGDEHMWIYSCWGCNRDQGTMTFLGWANRLRYTNDPRAVRAMEVAEFIQDWKQKQEHKNERTYGGGPAIQIEPRTGETTGRERAPAGLAEAALQPDAGGAGRVEALEEREPPVPSAA